MEWTEKSRYNTLRHYKVSSNETTLTVTCEDVLYYSMSMNKTELHSVDPDGGPYLCVSRIIEHEHQKWVINRIQSHKKNNSTVVFVFDIQKVGSV